MKRKPTNMNANEIIDDHMSKLTAIQLQDLIRDYNDIQNCVSTVQDSPMRLHTRFICGQYGLAYNLTMGHKTLSDEVFKRFLTI